MQDEFLINFFNSAKFCWGHQILNTSGHADIVINAQSRTEHVSYIFLDSKMVVIDTGLTLHIDGDIFLPLCIMRSFVIFLPWC